VALFSPLPAHMLPLLWCAGQNLNRNGACRDGSASVIVRTTDTCPCQYKNNYYSNKRWCCGDVVSGLGRLQHRKLQPSVLPVAVYC
jgi:hypothetical protein